jgi:hypothetical protein
VNTFNPEMVVIGGVMSRAAGHLLPAVNRVVDERALAEIRRQTRVVVSAFGPDASVMGAVALVVKAILKQPTTVGWLNPRSVDPRKEVNASRTKAGQVGPRSLIE